MAEPTNKMLLCARKELRWIVESLAESVETLSFGWAASSRAFGRVWTLNKVHVDTLLSGSEAGDVLNEAERLQRETGFTHIVVDEPQSAEALEGIIDRSCWRVERLVIMGIQASPDREDERAAVSVLSEAEAAVLMRRWGMEDFPEFGQEVVEQLAEYSIVEGRLLNERALGIRNDDGEPVAVTKLRSKHRLAWVEDVYTVPEARGNGYARTLVTHALRLAQAGANDDGTLLIADDEGWPKELYHKLGFRPIGFMTSFHRDTAET
jgi:GNAT superfamily N-acetyltransferase